MRVSESVRQLEETNARYEKCFDRIVKALDIIPLELIALADDNEENTAELLAKYIEKREATK